MRQLTAYASYLDNLGAPLVGRARFYNLDGSPAVVYGLDNAHQNYVQLGHIVYTNSSGQLVPQVFLADHDYIIVFDKYIGCGTMSEDDDPESWQELGSAVDRYNTIGIELDGSAVRSFSTVDALRAAIPVESADGDNEIVELLGYNEPGDKPSIQYQWDPNSSEPDNGGSVLGTGAVGRWKLVECPEFLDVRHFGAFPDQTSEGNADQRNRVQLAGAYAHFNSCGIHFYGDALAVYYDISGLELFKTTSDDLAKVYAVSGTESTIREVVNINCGADQFTPLLSQGKITLYGDMLRASFAPNYNIQFNPTRKIIIDANVDTSNLEIWNALVEVTVDKTTSHWVFNNCQFESDHRIGNDVTFNGPTELKQRYFSFTDMDYDTITVNNSVLLDIDDWWYVNDWCKLVKQQSRRDFDIKGRTLDSNCDLSFNDGSTLILRNAVFNGFSFGNMNVSLHSCNGSISFSHSKTLRLFDCSGGIVLSSISQNATVWSRYSQITLSGNVIIDRVNMLGGILSYQDDTPFTLSTKSSFEALSARIYCSVEGAYDVGHLSLTDCVVTHDVGGKVVFLRGCTVSDANVDAYSPYNGTDRNLITVEATGNKFLGSSKLRLRTTYSGGSTTVYDLSFNVCGNFSDHDFIDDSAFNGATHTAAITKCVYKGNYGGCPTESAFTSQNITYSYPETLTSGGNNGEVPGGQSNNTLKLYIDNRPSNVSGWDCNTKWWSLKVSKSLVLDDLNVFRFKHFHVASQIRVLPRCICSFYQSGYNECVNEIPMIAAQSGGASQLNTVIDSMTYSGIYTIDYGMVGSTSASQTGDAGAITVKIGQRENYMIDLRFGVNIPTIAVINWDIDEVGFQAYTPA